MRPAPPLGTRWADCQWGGQTANGRYRRSMDRPEALAGAWDCGRLRTHPVVRHIPGMLAGHGNRALGSGSLGAAPAQDLRGDTICGSVQSIERGELNSERGEL